MPPYKTFNAYLTEQFGTRVYRVPLDAGFDCPNRDGTRAFGGCTFCDERGSGAPTIKAEQVLAQQLKEGTQRIRRRFKARKFLAYFQAFSNTYAPEGVLKNLYDTALAGDDIVGLCIGTRPDCVPDNVLDLLAEYNKKTYVLLELGLQTAVNRTLDLINRGHTAEEFFDAVQRAQKRGLRVATHLIFGLPGESKAEMLDTVCKIAPLKLEGLKIHQLCIYKGTPMEADYKAGRIKLIEEDAYVDLVAEALSILPPDTVIMRLVGEGTRDEIVAPQWALEKERVMKRIDAAIEKRACPV